MSCRHGEPEGCVVCAAVAGVEASADDTDRRLDWPAGRDGMFGFRVRTGVARFPDGWNVVVRFGDDPPKVYDPTFATHEEAEAVRARLTAGFLAEAERMGIPVERRQPDG